jgi:hypothetical protein
MKSGSIQILLVIVISFFILFFPAYFRYTHLSEITIFSTDLSFEIPDQDDQLQDQQHGSASFLQSVFSTPLLPEANPFTRFCHFFSSAPSLGQKTSILRC